MDLMSIRRGLMSQMANQIGKYINITTATSNPVEFANQYMSDCNKPNRLYNVCVVSFAETAVNNQLITLNIVTDNNGEPINLGAPVGLRYRNSSFLGYNFLSSYDAKTSVGDKYYLIESDILNF